MADKNGDDLINERIEKVREEARVAALMSLSAQRREELRTYIQQCYESSSQWRKPSFEGNWDKWHRNVRNVYDPDRLAQKEPWQIAMFVPLTCKHKERAKSQLVRSLIGQKPHFEIESLAGGTPEQAEMIKDLLLYYIDKANFLVAFNDQCDQGTTYGSGFLKLYWKRETQKRRVREPLRETQNVVRKLAEFLISGKWGGKALQYREVEKEIVAYDGIVAEFVDIHDVFPDPKDPTCKKSWIIQRFKRSYGWLVKGVQEGWADKGAIDRLRNIKEDEQPEEDKQTERQDVGETIPPIARTDYEKPHTLFEFVGPLPRKWIYPDKFSESEGEELVPATGIYAPMGQEVIAVNEMESYDGDNRFNKLDYIRVPGWHYGIGVPELLWAIQEEMNELRNQRVDNGVLQMNVMTAVMEDAIVSRDDFVSKPGGIIRVKRGHYDDIRKALIPLNFGTPGAFTYQETLELEREAQEVTGITRMTFGSGGQFGKDVNQTARGMMMLKQSSMELMSYYASLVEMTAFVQALRQMYVLIYSHIPVEDLYRILGPARAVKFELMPIEEVEKHYKFKPTGTFTMENKWQKAQALLAFRAAYLQSPYLKEPATARRIARLMDIDDPDEIIMGEDEMGKMAPGALGLPQGTTPEGAPGAPGAPRGTPPVASRMGGMGFTGEMGGGGAPPIGLGPESTLSPQGV